LFLLPLLPPSRSSLFPYTTLFRSTLGPAFSWFYNNLIKPVWDGISSTIKSTWDWIKTNVFDPLANAVKKTLPDAFEAGKDAIGEDRKSTRLNSSHVSISYAVFCLK